MRTYLEFALKKFQNKMTYRLDFFMGIVNMFITIVVYLCIYRALYAEATEVDGILVNVDGNSNRVAAIAYGPKNVIRGWNETDTDL